VAKEAWFPSKIITTYPIIDSFKTPLAKKNQIIYQILYKYIKLSDFEENI